MLNAPRTIMIVIHVAAHMTQEESSRIRVDEFDIGWYFSSSRTASLDTDIVNVTIQ